MFCLYSPVNIKFNKSFSQYCIANKLQIAVSQFLQRFMPRNFQKYFMFAKIISMLANTHDAPFFPPFFLVSKFTFSNKQDKKTPPTPPLPLTFKGTPNTSPYRRLTTGS